jgi:fatty-acyl-CoA synthase
VSHANLAANCHAISEEHMRIDRDKDLGLAWLPLYHDMGLIGFVCAPLFARMSCVLYPTASFVWNPSSWMELVHRHRATITFAPNFAYRLAALRQKRVEELDLSCLRIAGCGAEPIHPETMRAFCDRFVPAGLRPEALTPAYGLAEHTLAVAFERTDEPLRTLRIDREAYLTGHVRTLGEGAEAAGMEVVSCGRPAAGHDFAIAAADGTAPLGERRVGEIVLRGPSAARGYFEDASATQALIVDGWLRTGDLGFLVDGRLYVSGRRKDLIIVSGKNYYPQEIEWSVAQLASVRSGSVAAFGIDVEGTERIVVVAETTTRDFVDLRARVEARVAETVGLSPYDVLLVPPNTVPRTSSGKVQRNRARALYLQSGVRAFVSQPSGSVGAPDTSA